MNTVSSRRQRYSTAFGALLGFVLLTYVLYTGLSMLAQSISPGVWGYIGAAGYLALVAPLPGLVIARSLSRFLRRWGVLMIDGAAAIVLAAVAGRLEWSAWVALVLIASVVVAYLILGEMLRTPVRLARRRATRILQHERPAEDDRWSSEDWEWAFTQVGTQRLCGKPPFPELSEE
ncbi:hypothetical protein MycrhDRAFT_5673 [Mycolicibacterium rhodesiae JS60]|nr:hypothetical protein MycrhDRAFT_5673 [Mycolicibacterium rhodesiae JS60]